MLYCSVSTPKYIQHPKPEKIIRVHSLEKIKAKGIRGHVVKNHMTFKDHIGRLSFYQ
jgi:hypothetical protein